MSRSNGLPGTFRPAEPVRVVRDSQLNGRPVLLLGWWLNPSGQVISVEVVTFTSTRQSYHIDSYPMPPATPDTVAPGLPIGGPRNG